MERRFEHKGWDVVIDSGTVAISNKPATVQAAREVARGERLDHPEPQHVVVPDSLIDAISDGLPPRTMREEGRC